jgi:hypothetical protein
MLSANCTKDEVMKLIDKDFSKQEIKNVCGDLKHSIINIEWIDLSKKECLAGGGEIYHDICLSNWYDATKICTTAGGRLATRYELKNTIIKCGGMIDEYDQNIKNKAFQKCYEKDGFSNIYDYWSSTSCRTNKADAWVAYIGSGNVYNYDKNEKSYVRCIKDEK